MIRKKNKLPTIKMHRKVITKVFNTIGCRPAETGGVLLGPVKKNEITDFYFDNNGKCSAVTYSPDFETINNLLKNDWAKLQIEFKGFIHSHLAACNDRLSKGDLIYIERLLRLNPKDKFFLAPIVIPEQFRYVPWIVLRGQYTKPVIADIQIV